jgi:hypothetical protein
MTRREAKGLLSTFKDRMQDVKRFFFHGAAYVAFNAVFATVNILEGPNGPVVLFPMMIWGAVLYWHSRQVFGRRGKVTKAWEERMIYELMHGEEMPEEKALLLQEVLKHRLALAPDESVEKLQQRIQNLEAIITSQQWESLEREEALLRTGQEDEFAKLTE